MFVSVVRLGGLCTCLALLVACSNPENKDGSMSESIFDATESQLTSAQAKITYLGSQLNPIPTVIFSATGYKPRLDLFLEVQPGHEPYQNDQTPYTIQFSVDPSVFRRILLAVKPVVTRSAMKSGLDLLAF